MKGGVSREEQRKFHDLREQNQDVHEECEFVQFHFDGSEGRLGFKKRGLKHLKFVFPLKAELRFL